MFPHSNTIYAVHELRRQEYLQEAERERLAAKAILPTRSRLSQLAASGRLQWALASVGAFPRIGTRTRRLSSPVSPSR